MSDGLDDIIDLLNNLKQDSGVPKNVKTKINQIIDILIGDDDESIMVDKVMHIFEGLNDDSNIDTFTRTQLWNIVSMLEAL